MLYSRRVSWTSGLVFSPSVTLLYTFHANATRVHCNSFNNMDMSPKRNVFVPSSTSLCATAPARNAVIWLMLCEWAERTQSYYCILSSVNNDSIRLTLVDCGFGWGTNGWMITLLSAMPASLFSLFLLNNNQSTKVISVSSHSTLQPYFHFDFTHDERNIGVDRLTITVIITFSIVSHLRTEGHTHIHAYSTRSFSLLCSSFLFGAVGLMTNARSRTSKWFAKVSNVQSNESLIINALINSDFTSRPSLVMRGFVWAESEK